MNLISKFDQRINQLICGRRGTGKTHVLGTMNELINKSKNQMSLYVSMGEIFINPPAKKLKENDSFDSSQHATDIFNSFIFLLIDRLSQVVNKKYLINSNIPDLTKKKTKEALVALMDTVNDGVMIKRILNYEEQSEDIYGEAEKKEWSLKFDVSADITKSNFGVSYDDSEDRESSKKNSKKGIYDAQVVPDIPKIRTLIKYIVELLHLDNIYILIDEWMQIDKTARLNVQPYLAELLKRCFFNERKISVKIATIWNETDLYAREDVKTSRGLQLGEDIVMGNDLDSFFVNEWDSLDGFFKELLFKRLLSREDHFYDFKLKDGSISDNFIIELFDSIDNFRELILASHGIPREFIKIFHKCAINIDCKFEDRAIDTRAIRKAAREIYLTEKRKRIDKLSFAFKQFEKINLYMEKKGNRFFYIDNYSAKHSLSLRKLVDEKLIHPIPSALIQREFRDKFKSYFIDYGNYIDWYESDSTKDNIPLPQSLVPPTIKIIDDYVIDITEFEDGIKICNVCYSAFSPIERSYTMKKLCPHCFERT